MIHNRSAGIDERSTHIKRAAPGSSKRIDGAQIAIDTRAQRRPIGPIPFRNRSNTGNTAGRSESPADEDASVRDSDGVHSVVHTGSHRDPARPVPARQTNRFGAARHCEISGREHVSAKCAQGANGAVNAVSQWRPGSSIPLRNSIRIQSASHKEFASGINRFVVYSQRIDGRAQTDARHGPADSVPDGRIESVQSTGLCEASTNKNSPLAGHSDGANRTVHARTERRPTHAVPTGDVGRERASCKCEFAANVNIVGVHRHGVDRSTNALPQHRPARAPDERDAPGCADAKKSSQINLRLTQRNREDVSVHAGILAIQERHP